MPIAVGLWVEDGGFGVVGVFEFLRCDDAIGDKEVGDHAFIALSACELGEEVSDATGPGGLVAGAAGAAGGRVAGGVEADSCLRVRANGDAGRGDGGLGGAVDCECDVARGGIARARGGDVGPGVDGCIVNRSGRACG